MPAMNTNLYMLLFLCTLNHGLCANVVDVDVGIVLDMESWIGKSIHGSIMMAISDFYARNHSYKTRVVVHTKDSKGNKLQALSTEEKLVSNLSRFVMFVWLIVVLVLISSYTATLTSLLTVEQFEIASKQGIVDATFFGGFTVNNTNFTGTMRSYTSYDDYAEVLAKGGKHGGADAIVDEVPYIKMFLGKYANGDYAMVSSEPVTSGFAFIFTKGSPLVKDISREIAKIREDGTLKLLEKKWFNTEFSVSPEDSSRKPKTLSFERFGGLFVISGVSSSLALIISLFYLIRAKMEILSIISLLGGRSLTATIRNLLHRKVIYR